ncbi:MAG: queuosine biosynthesis protein QueD [Holophagaceae bacterium]|nr:queuosine biosynthesis protein QueD [Holophagaceae bacterium]
MILRKEFSFEAGHFIYNHPGKCRNMHGHSYKLYVSVGGPVNPETGMVIDFGDLVRIVQEAVIEKLDHHFLNDIIPLSTSENISVWIWQQLKPLLPGLCQLELFETTGSCVVYRGE